MRKSRKVYIKEIKMKNNNRDEISANIKSRHLILNPNGNEIELDFDELDKVKKIVKGLGSKELEAYILGEEVKCRKSNEPPSIKEMRRLQLFDYEPASDSGHFRMYPKGFLIADLLKLWADRIALDELNALQIESPLLYNWEDEDIKEQGGSFHENHYRVSVPGDKDKYFVLRFAGDFGLFKIMKQAKFSHKMMPLRIYEYSKSFRYERRGALAGLKRLRAFHMPDVHCFCRNKVEGWVEYQMLYRKYSEMADNIGIPYAVGFRIVEDFYKKYKEKIVELIKYSGKPAYVDVLSEMKHYWAVKHEFQGIDSSGGSVQLSTVQLDVKDSKVYGIKYIDCNGEKQPCLICHSSIGSIERWIYCLLENALKLEKPVLPYWLSPCQFRLIPVSDKHIPYCEEIMPNKVRSEIDDRSESLNKKIRSVNRDWIPYYSVIGDKEIKSGVLELKSRYDSEAININIDDLKSFFNFKLGDFPFKRQSLPGKMSLHPVFFG